MISALVTCDAEWPQRTPQKCRAFLAVPPHSRQSVAGYAMGHGWSITNGGGLTFCPSCTRARRQIPA